MATVNSLMLTPELLMDVKSVEKKSVHRCIFYCSFGVLAFIHHAAKFGVKVYSEKPLRYVWGNTLFRSSCCCLDASLYVLVSYGLAYLMGHNPIVYRACPTVRQTVPHGRLKDKVAKSRPLLAPRRVCFVKGFCEILFYTGWKLSDQQGIRPSACRADD